MEKEGILFLPQKAKEDNTPLPSTGIVLGYGHLVSEYEQGLMPLGSGVLFGKFAGTNAVVGGVEYRIINFEEILCRVEEPENPEAYAVTTD